MYNVTELNYNPPWLYSAAVGDRRSLRRRTRRTEWKERFNPRARRGRVAESRPRENNAVYFPHSLSPRGREERIFSFFPERAVKLGGQIAAGESVANARSIRALSDCSRRLSYVSLSYPGRDRSRAFTRSPEFSQGSFRARQIYYNAKNRDCTKLMAGLIDIELIY